MSEKSSKDTKTVRHSLLRSASDELIEAFQCTCRRHPCSMGEYISCNNSSVTTTLFPDSEHDTMEQNTLTGSIFTLTNTILGGGTLAVPFAIACSGYILGLLILIILAMVTRYSVKLLLQASDMAGVNCAKTYESLGHLTMGKYGTWLAEFTFIFGGFGTLMSNFIFISDLFCVALNIPSTWNNHVMIVCTIGFIMPLSFSQKIGKLQYVSLLATLSVAYVVIFTLFSWITFQHAQREGITVEPVKAVLINTDSVYTITLLLGAYACHNTTLPVYEELKDRTFGRMQRAVSTAISIAFVLYTIIGLSGYLSFSSSTMDNLLLNYSDDVLEHYPQLKVSLRLVRLCMASALLLTCPTILWPFRSCICSAYLRITHGQQLPSSATSYTEFITITILAETLVLFCAMAAPSVKIPLSIVGSVSGSLIIFIMPSLFYMLQRPDPLFSWIHRGPLCLLFSGIVIGIVGFSLTINKILM